MADLAGLARLRMIQWMEANPQITQAQIGRALGLTQAWVSKAWGAFSRHNLRRTFREAVRKARATWAGRWPAPENLRPYDLRHAFLTEVYRRTKDLRATAELAMHSDLSMTARYAEAAVTATASAARDLMDSEAPNVAPRKKARKKR